MAYQLTIRNQDAQTGNVALRRRRVVTCEQPRLRLGGSGCDIELAGEDGELLRLETGVDGVTHVFSERFQHLRVGREKRFLPLSLVSGDDIEVGSWSFKYYVRKAVPGLSWQGTALSRFSLVAVLLVLLAEFFAVAVLPLLVIRADPSGSAVARQRVTDMLDTLRRRAAAVTTEDVLQHYLTTAVRDELDARARYLRQYDDDMSRSQRREMLADLQRLAYLLDRVEDGSLLAPLPAPVINPGVEHLLQRSRGEHSPKTDE